MNTFSGFDISKTFVHENIVLLSYLCYFPLVIRPIISYIISPIKLTMRSGFDISKTFVYENIVLLSYLCYFPLVIRPIISYIISPIKLTMRCLVFRVFEVAGCTDTLLASCLSLDSFLFREMQSDLT